MSNDLLALPEKEKKELDAQLTAAFVKVSNVSKEMESAKEKGQKAKGMAESVKTGIFNSNTKAIQELRVATITTADTTLETLDVVSKVSTNQRELAEACKNLFYLGAVNIDQTRATIEFIKKTMAEGAKESLNEEAIAQLEIVMRDLKDRADFLYKQKEQGDKINDHERRLKDNENLMKEIDDEINQSRKMEIRHDNAIDDLYTQGAERDKLINECFERNNEQDERLNRIEKKIIDHNTALEELQNKVEEYDKVQADFESRIKQLENDILRIKNSKRTQVYFAICVSMGLAGVILAIIALFIN